MKRRKNLAVLLTLVMLLSLFPAGAVTAGAADSTTINLQVVNENYDPVSGATVQVLDSGNNQLFEFESDGDIHTTGELTAGSYTIRVTNPAYGYRIPDDITVTVDENGGVTASGDYDDYENLLTVELEKNKVAVWVVDKASGDPLDGIYVEVLDGDGNVLCGWSSEDDEPYVIDGLSAGVSYTLRVVDDYWYRTPESITFSVDETGAVITGAPTDEAGNILIKLQPIYSVYSNGPFAGGSVTIDPEIAAADETVTLDISPDEGCSLLSLNLDDDSIAVTKESETKYSFIMPSYDVYVSAVFVREVSIGLGENTVSIPDSSDIKVVGTFTPEKSGSNRYHVYSEGEGDPYVKIYDGEIDEDNLCARDDNLGEGNNFDCTVYLEGGRTYTFEFGANDQGAFDMTVTLEEDTTPMPENLTMGENKVPLCTVIGDDDSNDYYVTIPFTTAEGGRYRFVSAGERDPFIAVQEVGAEGPFAEDDDGGEDYNFDCVAELEGGTTYEVRLGIYEKDATISFTISGPFEHTDWDDLRHALGANGTITLEKDYTADSCDLPLAVPEGVTATLDLNGHTIDGSAMSAREADLLDVEGTLTIKDSGTGGAIIGNDFSSVAFVGKGNLTMSGGTMRGDNLDYSVYVDEGKFTMTGGTITGNEQGYGVYVNNRESGAFTVSGDPVIDCGIYLYEDCVITIGGPLTWSSPVCVFGKNNGVFTSGWAQNMSGEEPQEYFSAPHKLYCIEENDGGELRIYLSPLNYIDENGDEQTCVDYTLIYGKEAYYTEPGWYVVSGQVSIKDIDFYYEDDLYPGNGQINLILCDDASLDVEESFRSGYGFAIYGQTQGTGAVNLGTDTVPAQNSLDFEENLVIHGGQMHVWRDERALNCYGDLVMTGGLFSATVSGSGEYTGDGVSIYGDFTVSGGKFNVTIPSCESATGIHCEEDITLSGGEVIADVSGNGTTGIRCSGNMTVSGGQVNVTASGEQSTGVFCYENMTVSGGEVIADVSGVRSKGIGCDFNMTFSDGQVKVTVSGEQSSGVVCYENMTVSGGRIIADASGVDSKGVSCYSDMTVSGGQVKVTDSDEDPSAGVFSVNCYGTLSLGWTDRTDSVLLSSINDCEVELTRVFTDGTDTFMTGSVEPDKIAGKLLTVPDDYFAINIDPEILHGSVTADLSCAKEGEGITLTVTGDENYALDSLTVKYGDTEKAVEDGQFEMPAQDVTVTAVFKATMPVLALKSLVLSGQIGVNFFMDLTALTDEEKADSYMEFTVNGKTQRADYNAGFRDESTGSYYGFTCFVSSIQMAETITAVFHWGNEQTEYTYSVKEYIEAFRNAGSDNKYVTALVESLADYGHYIQPFLAWANGWTVGEKYKEMDVYYYDYYDDFDLDYVQQMLEQNKFTSEITGNDIETITYNLILDSETTLCMYFMPAEGYTGSFSAEVDGQPVTAANEGGRYVVRIPKISAHMLSETHTIEVTTDNGEVKVSVSALSYANGVLNTYTENGDYFKHYAAAALLRYSMAADNYKASING